MDQNDSIKEGDLLTHDTTVADLRQKLAESERRSDAIERAALIKDARAVGKLAPVSVEWAETVPLATLRSFLETAPMIPQFVVKHVEPAHTRGFTWQGKAYAQLTALEKAELHRTNRDLFDAMRAETDAAGEL